MCVFQYTHTDLFHLFPLYFLTRRLNVNIFVMLYFKQTIPSIHPFVYLYIRPIIPKVTGVANPLWTGHTYTHTHCSHTHSTGEDDHL